MLNLDMTRVAGTRRAVPDVVWRLVERGLPELVVAGPAGDPDVTHAAAAFGSLPGRRADAGLPADLGATGPELMTERAELGLVFEDRYRHGNDHAQAGGVSVKPPGLSISGMPPAEVPGSRQVGPGRRAPAPACDL